MEILIRDEQKLQVDKRAIARAIRKTLLAETSRDPTSDIRHLTSAHVSVRLVDREEMRRLNLLYLATDAPTDVLAFDLSGGPCPEGAEDILGEVILCPEYAARSASRLGHSLRREMIVLAVHGALHLMGYDDESPADRSVMFARQEQFVERIAGGDPSTDQR